MAKRKRKSPQLTRFQKARALINLNGIKVISTDNDGRIKSAFVNGSQAKTYQVILKRNRQQGTIVAECLLETGNGNIDCPSARYTICYHVLATIIKSAEEMGYKVLFSDTEEKAKKLLNFGGSIYKVISEREGGENPIFMVANTK